MGIPAQICVSDFQPGGYQLLGLFVNWVPAQICVSNFQPGGAQLLGLFVNGMPAQTCVSNFRPGAMETLVGTSAKTSMFHESFRNFPSLVCCR